MVLGVISKPKVPALKQVNLYQNGFLSVSGVGLQGPGTCLSPQIGTGNNTKSIRATYRKSSSGGFWPKVVQVICEKPFPAKKNYQ
jgi:hypothetical protein